MIFGAEEHKRILLIKQHNFIWKSLSLYKTESHLNNLILRLGPSKTMF